MDLGSEAPAATVGLKVEMASGRCTFHGSLRIDERRGQIQRMHGVTTGGRGFAGAPCITQKLSPGLG